MSRVKLAFNWGASCGGCDVSILDVGRAVLDLPQTVDVVYWPVALDYKRKDLEALDDKSVDIGIVNGAVRTSEQEEEAKLIRAKCRYVVAYGSCACFGGIPGLANQFGRNELLERAYIEAPSNTNEAAVTVQSVSERDGFSLTLPEFLPEVRTLDQVIEVNHFVPGCPPSTATITELLETLGAIAGGKTVKRILAADKCLCYECPRGKTKEAKKAEKLYRPHELISDGERCLLEQGIVCLGFATRGGCGSRCVAANMPCRGCYGRLPDTSDPGAEAMSALAAVAGDWEDYLPTQKIFDVLDAVRDAVGTFYTFSLPSALLKRERG
jgi:F420-non-reducing hydrogenase small subunit